MRCKLKNKTINQEFINTINLFNTFEISLIEVSGLIEIDRVSLFFTCFFIKPTPHNIFIKYII